MASKQQRVDAAKKRDKRSKVMLIGLGVVLVAVGIFEIPSMLAVMNKKPPPGTKYDPGPSSVVPGSLPNVAASATGVTPAAAPAASTGQLVNTDVPPTSADGQLVTFEVFETKNPFRPQVTSSPAGTATASSPGANVPGHAPTSTLPTLTIPTTPTSTTPASAVPSAGGASTPTTTPSAAPAVPTVTISVNGQLSKVGSGAAFPTGTPVFRLVSYQQGSAQVGIVGGSYAAGGATLTLQLGHPVTLQNTADGKQYRLELLKTP